MNPLRLSYLSTQLLRQVDSTCTARVSPTRRSPAVAAAFFHISRHRNQTSRPQRYGTAKQPPPHLAEEKLKLEDNDTKVEKEPEANLNAEPTADEAKSVVEPTPTESPVTFPSNPDKAAASDSAKPASSLDRVLDVSSPNEPDEAKPPHLQAPKYVHHFDTWGLVKDLQTGGFSQDQSVTIMKAVRGLLADNMGLARKALVSKSNVENETYLFKAACSELKTEVQNNRKAEADTWRSQRAQQQHEVDIISQTMTQDSSGLKDELRGIFDDRKMSVRMEQKQMEAKVCFYPVLIPRLIVSRFKSSTTKSP
jgi:Protein of unknown function (DUF1640)